MISLRENLRKAEASRGYLDKFQDRITGRGCISNSNLNRNIIWRKTRYSILYIPFFTEKEHNQLRLSQSLSFAHCTRSFHGWQRPGCLLSAAHIVILLSARMCLPLNLSIVMQGQRKRETERRRNERGRRRELKPGLHQSQRIIFKAYYTKYQGLAFLRLACAFKHARQCT